MSSYADHNERLIATFKAYIEQLEAMLREVMEQCPEHLPYGLKNQIRAVLGVSDDQ